MLCWLADRADKFCPWRFSRSRRFVTFFCIYLWEIFLEIFKICQITPCIFAQTCWLGSFWKIFESIFKILLVNVFVKCFIFRSVIWELLSVGRIGKCGKTCEEYIFSPRFSIFLSWYIQSVNSEEKSDIRVSGNLISLCVITQASLDFKTSFLRLVVFFGGNFE